MARNIAVQYVTDRYDGKGSFTLWQTRVKDLLVQQGLARALKGLSGKPEKMSDDDWEDIESKCLSTIRQNIGDNIINNFIDEDTVPKLWDKLEKMYLGKNLTTKLNLKRDLYRLKMGEGGNLMDHMNKFHGLVDQLKKVDVKIEEEDEALLLLTSLPDSYENIVTTVLYGKDTLKMVDVESTLLSNDKRKSSCEEISDSAMIVHDQNRGRNASRGSGGNSRSRSKGGGKGKQCYKCKQWGHIKWYCPLNKEGDTSNATIACADEGNFGDALTVSKFNSLSQSDWILDSGSSNHICFKKEYFDSFKERANSSLTLPNGNKCTVVGVGTVRIKMFDGVERTLGGVAYVPKLRKNIISISQLDSKGCHVSVEGGAMQITRGGKVLAKGEEKNGLYRLIQTSRKRGAQDIKRLKRVSFDRTKTKTHVSCFQAKGEGEIKIPTREGVIMKSPFGVGK
ncbi:hypothetical protein LguiA_033944 [Lonicera macranthoides]